MDESLRRIWTAYLSSGSLSPEEEGELVKAFQSSEETREALLRDFEVHRMLQGRGRSELDAPDFLRAFSRALAAEGDATRFIQKVESRIERIGAPLPAPSAPASPSPEERAAPRTREARGMSVRRSALRPGGTLIPALIAAGIFIAVLIIFALSSTDPDPSGPPRGARLKPPPSGVGQDQARGDRGERRGADRPQETVPPGDKGSPPKMESPQAPPDLEPPKKGPKNEKAETASEPKDVPVAPKPGVNEKAPERPKEERPLRSPIPPELKPEGKTLTAIATLEEVSGQAYLLNEKGKSPVASGTSLVPASSLQTVGKSSRMVLRFPDKTRVELGPDSVLRDIGFEAGKRMTLEAGLLGAEVSRQPENESMVVKTPHGEVRVLGTVFRLLVDPDPKKGTRLEVEEGRVEIRNLSGARTEVAQGQFAVAREGMELSARSLSIDEIVLLPRQAVLVGNEWALAKDRGALGGVALFSRETTYKVRSVGTGHVYDGVKNRSAYLLFNFQAEGGKDYSLWIRGRSLPEDPKHLYTSELAVEVANAQLSLVDGQAALAGDNAYSYTGFFHFPGYGWIGGRGEFGKGDAVPLSLRFTRSGPQTLKIHALQAPAWLDSVWLSATQKTRPEAGQTGPVKR